MDNKKLVAIWEEIERIAREDIAYINTSPDVDGIAEKYLQTCIAFLNERGTK